MCEIKKAPQIPALKYGWLIDVLMLGALQQPSNRLYKHAMISVFLYCCIPVDAADRGSGADAGGGVVGNSQPVHVSIYKSRYG